MDEPHSDMITPDSEGFHVVERRLRRDRRLGLQRRIGDRRQDEFVVPVERREIASRRGAIERRRGHERRVRANARPLLA